MRWDFLVVFGGCIGDSLNILLNAHFGCPVWVTISTILYHRHSEASRTKAYPTDAQGCRWIVLPAWDLGFVVGV